MSLHSVPVPEFLHPSSYLPIQINTYTLKEPYIYNLTQEIHHSYSSAVTYTHNQSTVSAAYRYITELDYLWNRNTAFLLYKQLSDRPRSHDQSLI